MQDEGGERIGKGKGGRRSPNDDRSNAKNPNNPAHSAARDNRANQLNPHHSAYQRSRASDSSTLGSVGGILLREEASDEPATQYCYVCGAGPFTSGGKVDHHHEAHPELVRKHPGGIGFGPYGARLIGFRLREYTALRNGDPLRAGYGYTMEDVKLLKKAIALSEDKE